MSVFNNFSKTDRIILGGSLVILVVLSYLLYDDSLIAPPQDHGHLQAIGAISFSDNDVRRKNSGNFVWLPGNKKDQVFNEDSIFTGDRSQASIQLNDGTLIQIQENSLVNLNLKNGQMELDLRFGQFVGDGKAPLRVRTGNEEYTIQGTDAKFEINRSQNGALDVKVLSGKAEISGKAGKQNLKENESLKISKSGAEKNQVDAKIRLLTKEGVYMYRDADKTPLHFEWEGRGPITQYQIEISKTEDFKKILAQRSVVDQKIALRDSLKEGDYFWRVQGSDIRRKPLATSAVQKFYLSYMKAPSLTSPEDQATLRTESLDKGEGLKAATRIAWESDERSVSYEWQLAKNAEFSEVIEKKTLSEKEIETSKLPQGIYFTRVRGFDSENHPSQWSKVISFNFEIDVEAKPPAPRLAEKNIRFQIPKEDRAPSATTSPQMAWSTVDVAKTYRWEIANNPKFAGVQFTETPNTKIAWTQYKPGKYYFRVFARTELGQNSAPSETGVLEVYGAAPVLNPVASILAKDTNMNAVAPPQQTKVTWSALPEAKSYILQLDKNPDFSQALDIEAAGNESLVTLPAPGRYFMRVKALNGEAQDVSDFSNTQDATYNFLVTLKTPELIEPYDKTTIFLQKDMEPFIWLEWSSVPNAVKYKLEVSSKADFSALVFTKTMAETRFLIREKIPYGNIYWRVRAVSSEESLHSEWAQRTFMFYHQQNRGF